METQTPKQASDSEQWSNQTDGNDPTVNGEDNRGKQNAPAYVYDVSGSGAYVLNRPAAREKLNSTLYQSRTEVFSGQLDAYRSTQAGYSRNYTRNN
jgi:hypothetical protein